jgi:transposase InsO family protein
VRLAGGKLAGRGAPAFLRPGNSVGIIASAAADAGSSEAPSRVAAAGDGCIKPGRLFFMQDAVSGLHFLIDTGSSYSILPHRAKARPYGPTLRAADGRRIRCWGQKAAEVKLGGHSYRWQFLLADIRFPILGVDFLREFQLVVDVVGAQLLPRTAAASAAATPDAGPSVNAVQQLASTEWSSIVDEFPGVIQPFTVGAVPSHGVEHHIVTTGPPATAKFRRLDPERLAAAKAEFQQMLQAGVVRRASSSWASPLHMVRKKDGGWRPCGDFRKLNTQTADDKYPLPNMGDLAGRLDGCVIFSKLDLQKGYFQVPVAAADVAKTAVITPFGLFEFLRMPFGLKNAGMTFQRLMDRVLFDIPYVFVYLDDMLVASRSAEEHRRHLREVLRRLQANGLVINASKCVWAQPSVEFLGHNISAAGLSPLPQRVEAISKFPQPQTVKQLQAFLGLFNFYRRFVPAAAAVIRPLTDALRGNPAGAAPVKWSAAMSAAFEASKAALAATTLLDHPAAAAELSLVTDASATHLGAVLQQKRPASAWRPLAFYSRKLSDAEQRYSAYDRELLAIHSSILHFRYMLEGRRFVVFTDHKPLVGALSRVSEPRSDRQRRQLSAIAEFSAEIRHIAGPSNVVADTLSRPAEPAASSASAAGVGPPEAPLVATAGQISAAAGQPPIDIAELAAEQPNCADCRAAETSKVLKVMTVQLEGKPVKVDVSSGVMRPLVPAAMRRRIFDIIHNLAHPGIRATRRLIASRYLWPGLATDVAAWSRECQQCQRGKTTKHARAAVQPIAVPTARFSHIHVDIVGPLPASSEGFQYLFTVIDRSTRWAEALPLKTVAAADCAAALVHGWVARFGVPACLTSDRGVQFASAVWAALMRQLGVQHVMTTAYHPQSNGAVERLHRRLKDALRARAADSSWPQHLPWVLLGIRSAPREQSGVSAAELVYGSPLQLPGQLLSAAEPPPEDFVRQINAGVPCVSPVQPPSSQQQSAVAAQLKKAAFVYVKSPPAAPALSPAFRGPYAVHKRGSHFFVIRMGQRYEAVALDRLKPHLGEVPLPADPPRRGRPPGRRIRE